MSYASLLRNSLTALGVCVALVVACYFAVDRPVAFFVRDNGLSSFVVLKWLTYTPSTMQQWVPAVLVLLAVRRAWGPLKKCERTVLVAGVVLVIADQFKESLAVVFGRYWPGTWTENNPSLLRDDAYGFHPFHVGSWYRSFPSGHTARAAAVAAVVWVAYPRWKWLGVLVALTVPVGLIGMNYHFVGDVFAGGFIGGIVGVYAAHLGSITSPPAEPSPPPG